jgi:hypothetical protein
MRPLPIARIAPVHALTNSVNPSETEGTAPVIDQALHGEAKGATPFLPSPFSAKLKDVRPFLSFLLFLFFPQGICFSHSPKPDPKTDTLS